jgi:LuxR family transcriptional regulator, maltose regulon positive regulatory protein
MATKPPRISEQWVYDDKLPEGRVQLDSAAWFAWLAAATTMRFSYPLFDREVGYIVGFMTVRKERRQRGGSYWVAYRRWRGKVRKAYIGASSAVTARCLHTIAQRLCGKEVPLRDEGAQ